MENMQEPSQAIKPEGETSSGQQSLGSSNALHAGQPGAIPGTGIPNGGQEGTSGEPSTNPQMYYQNPMMYAMYSQGGGQGTVNAANNPQMMRMRQPGLYYYPMGMQAAQQQPQQQGGQGMPAGMPNYMMTSKFMPQYSAYLGRMQSGDVKKEEGAAPAGASGPQEAGTDVTGGDKEADKKLPIRYPMGMMPMQQGAPGMPLPQANQGMPMQHGVVPTPQPMHPGVGSAGTLQGAPPGMQFPMPPYGMQPGIVGPSGMYYGPRLMVGNAIDGIPALRHASSQFKSVHQMLDALATQPRKKKKPQRSREVKNEDPDFKNVLQEYFSADGSDDASDDEYVLGRGVKSLEMNGIRRSGRTRTKNQRYDEYAESDADTFEEPTVKVNVTGPRRKRGPALGTQNRRPVKPAPNPYARTNYVTYDSSDEGSQYSAGRKDDENFEGYNKDEYDMVVSGLSLRHRKQRINYAEMENEEYSDAGSVEESAEQKESTGGIDRIINHRVNDEGETEYLIKWQGFAHIHNTWDSYENLKEYNGIRRLDNYIKRLKNQEDRQRYMSLDEIEQENIAAGLQRQIDEDALQAERLIVHYKDEETGKLVYLVKWRSCPYDQCTEEEEDVLREHGFSDLIDAYHKREDRICGDAARSIPWNTHSISLTKFEPYLQTPPYLCNPDYLEQLGYIRRPGPVKVEGAPGDGMVKPEEVKGEVPVPGRKLRDYQLTGLNWMVNRMKRGLSVLLADEMGLGKTVQTISLVGHFMYKEFLIGPYLIIVPQSTIDNWMREFETWLPQANAVCYYGNASAREIIRQRELCRVFVPGKGERYRCDVCITTPSIINAPVDLEFLRRISWQLMVVDEAHQLKNKHSKRFVELMQFMADYKLLLSGTPLHNNLEELWTLLHFINPQIYTYYEDFRRRYSDVENPAAIGENKQKQLLSLQQELHEFVLRRVKRDVEKSLPNKVERILRVELSPMQIEWYKNILARNYEELAKNSGGSRSSLQNICMELKKVCNHPFLCYEPEDRQQWLNGLIYGSGKICLLDKLLQRLKEKGHRVLIFSQMVRMLNIISEYLTLRGFKHQRLDGTMGKEVRKKAMDHFNDPNSDDFCFLLSTKAGGLGINLTTADTVIIYDSDWNPQNDLQAEARAHRIGQTKTVQIYRLVTKDSIEQTILERAKTKMVLDALVVQGLNKKSDAVVFQDDMGKSGFSREELAKILKFGASKLWSTANPAKASADGLDIDLDKVLEEAELTKENDSDLAADLLSSYTNITEFRYEPPEGQIEASSENDKEFWEATIPLEERVKLKKKKEEELLVMGPRRTRAKEVGAMETDDFSDDEGDADFQPRRGRRASTEEGAQEEVGSRKRGRKVTKKVVLTVKDRIKIHRSLCKFGVPELRLKDIHADTKLTKVDPRVILNECQNLIDMCKARIASADGEDDVVEEEEVDAAQNSTVAAAKKRSRRSSKTIELGEVKISPADFLEKLTLLEALEQWGRSQGGPNWAKLENSELTVPSEIIEYMSEGKETWTNDDCINLLKLVHIYGYGYWTLMCADKTHCVGVLKDLKHDRAKARALRILKVLLDYRSGHVIAKPTKRKKAKVPQEGESGQPVVVPAGEPSEPDASGDVATAGDDDGESSTISIEDMLISGEPLHKEHYPLAVKWALKGSRDMLKRLKHLKEECKGEPLENEQLRGELENAIPELNKLIEAAVGICTDEGTATKLKSACWRFIAKLVNATPEQVQALHEGNAESV
ncbi:helicase family member protein [Theileria equi strain WA]|uniref:Helicase family member protein n=1 Tax=Theileria equi strain WA TaxID=1537102 RepID=L1LEX5_THEEQ|nr:helicase family member protein [Theileria equi strain WA]EKX73997.1 helicase family member protein [Theileria equi strain WA]|eukprot:XP_004833449.1 helicase family member protein [Theileria equi strain WA]